MTEVYTGLPIGKKVAEYAIVSKVAEAAIPILANQEYVPVIKGTANYQVLAATDSAATVIGFAKRPTNLALSVTSIPISTKLDVVVAGVIKIPTGAGVTINDYLEVHSTTTQVATLTVSAVGDFAKCVARALDTLGAAGDCYVKIGL